MMTLDRVCWELARCRGIADESAPTSVWEANRSARMVCAEGREYGLRGWSCDLSRGFVIVVGFVIVELADDLGEGAVVVLEFGARSVEAFVSEGDVGYAIHAE